MIEDMIRNLPSQGRSGGQNAPRPRKIKPLAAWSRVAGLMSRRKKAVSLRGPSSAC